MTERLKVLIVDDEEKIRTGCRRILNEAGYDTATAENGRVALEILAKDDIDLMLLDLKMPVMDGEEVLEAAHNLYSDLPIIIITGHGTVDTAVECMKKGAYDFVTKPFRMRHFLLSVNRAAERRRLGLRARRIEEENIRNFYDLNLEKSRLKTIINCLANGVLVTNRNREVVLHNPAFCRLLDIPGQVKTPIPLEELDLEPPLAETLLQILAEEYQAGELISQEIEAREKTIRAISAAAPGPDGKVAGAVTVLEDITAFKQLDQMKSDFIDMVAHELRNPLYSVRQLLSVQVEGLCGSLNDRQADYLQRSLKQIDNLLELIRDLLDISKAESGILVRHHVPINLEDILEEVVELLEVRAREGGIQLKLEVRDSKPVRADRKSMEEVFNNLLANAINYSPDGGRVSVRVKCRGDFVEIEVADTGVGIAPEELPRIFDKFYRVKHPRTRQVVGSGLGLSLVKSVIEAHRGSLEVESTPEVGSCFRIALPASNNRTLQPEIEKST